MVEWIGSMLFRESMPKPSETSPQVLHAATSIPTQRLQGIVKLARVVSAGWQRGCLPKMCSGKLSETGFDSAYISKEHVYQSVLLLYMLQAQSGHAYRVILAFARVAHE